MSNTFVTVLFIFVNVS